MSANLTQEQRCADLAGLLEYAQEQINIARPAIEAGDYRTALVHMLLIVVASLAILREHGHVFRRSKRDPGRA
jgi:hypothetical protein